MRLDLHPSRYFLALIMLSHVTAMVIILALPLQWWAMVIIEALLAGSFVHMVKKYITRISDKIIVALWKEEGRNQNWMLMTRIGDKYSGVLLKDSSSSALLVVLNFKIANGKRQSILVFPDSVDKSSFRRLRVYLKTGKF